MNRSEAVALAEIAKQPCCLRACKAEAVLHVQAELQLQEGAKSKSRSESDLRRRYRSSEPGHGSDLITASQSDKHLLDQVSPSTLG